MSLRGREAPKAISFLVFASSPSAPRKDKSISCSETDLMDSGITVIALVPSITGKRGILNFFFLCFCLLPIGMLRLCSLKIALILDFETLTWSFSRIN